MKRAVHCGKGQGVYRIERRSPYGESEGNKVNFLLLQSHTQLDRQSCLVGSNDCTKTRGPLLVGKIIPHRIHILSSKWKQYLSFPIILLAQDQKASLVSLKPQYDEFHR